VEPAGLIREEKAITYKVDSRRGTGYQLLRAMAKQLFGALHRATAKAGYSDLKEFQKGWAKHARLNEGRPNGPR
jgi:hypothetical protein